MFEPSYLTGMKIRRVDALRMYDIKEDALGKQVVFSIKFVKKNGELVFLPRAVATGLPFNASVNRMRGVRPVDKTGNPIGHVYPVLIDNIIEFNQHQVIL